MCRKWMIWSYWKLNFPLWSISVLRGIFAFLPKSQIYKPDLRRKLVFKVKMYLQTSLTNIHNSTVGWQIQIRDYLQNATKIHWGRMDAYCGCEKSIFIDEGQKSDSLPSKSLPIHIHFEMLRIEVLDWGLPVCEQMSVGFWKSVCRGRGKNAHQLIEGFERISKGKLNAHFR